MDASTAKVSKTWGRGGFQNQSNRGRGGPTPGPGRGRGQSARGRGGQSQNRGQGPFCPGCYYLSQQLGTTIHFRHTPGDCPRKAVAVKMFQMEDAEYFGDTLTPVSMGDHLTTTNTTCMDNHLTTTDTTCMGATLQPPIPRAWMTTLQPPIPRAWVTTLQPPILLQRDRFQTLPQVKQIITSLHSLPT